MQLEEIFSQDGLLAKKIDNFAPRAAQLTMAQAISCAISDSTNLVIEAGTGTGKTFSYLVPALESSKKVIISTGSKNLQDQLFKRDLPFIKNALNYYGRVSLLKGRANYICRERLNKMILEGHTSIDQSQLIDLIKVRTWSSTSEDGDLTNCPHLAEDNPLIKKIVSTSDNCLGKDCYYYNDCFVKKAREEALEADLVVVNHHLFLADMALKDTGFGELLPAADVIILDEAHQIPDIACQYFGTMLSSYQLNTLINDAEVVYTTELGDLRQLSKAALHLKQLWQVLQHELHYGYFQGDWPLAISSAQVGKALQELAEGLDFMHAVVAAALGRSQLLDSVFTRIEEYQELVKQLQNMQDSDCFYWFSTSLYHFKLHITPLSIAAIFSKKLNANTSWIFTSATLGVNGDFSHFTNRLGLTSCVTKTLNSPFDYTKQAVLCVPQNLPVSLHHSRANALATLLAPVVIANKGRCFLLCTSHVMVEQFANLLKDLISLPILVQGEMPKSKLLARYLELGNALLIATGAFWEGVDVKGKALSCVIIDKLPFKSPDDPLLKARIRACIQEGGEPFSKVQLPDAVISLKQGLGRLIRDYNDRGLLIVCDPRLITKNYGTTFIESLPKMPKTRNLQACIEFLKRIDIEK